jgi:hypothetical protein
MEHNSNAPVKTGLRTVLFKPDLVIGGGKCNRN